MKKGHMLKNNSGASLILVIVALLFVGIIASIILTVTVGNRKSSQVSMESSENFYTTESVLDDFKVYLKKLATAAATNAYAAVHEDATLEFKDTFKLEMLASLQREITEHATVNGDGVKEFNEEFVRNNITYNRGSKAITNDDGTVTYSIPKVTISFDEPKMVSGELVFSNVKITYRDPDSNVETSVTTSFNFDANEPGYTESSEPGTFAYDVDHFVIIAGGDIEPASNDIGGATKKTYIGNLYTYGNLNVSVKSISGGDDFSNELELKAEKILVNKDIDVKKGKLTLSPINDNKVIYKAGEYFNNNVWFDSMLVGNASVETTSASVSGESTVKLGTVFKFRKNLELNGISAYFKANGGEIYGYMNEGTIYEKTEQPISSAIILNGLGAKLDLKNLKTLRLAGYAFTEMNDLDGSPLGKKAYFTQGESITYRPVQALYLVPGDFLKGIGHNPMTHAEWESIKSDPIEISDASVASSINSFINSGKVVAEEVRYVGAGSAPYVYVFWDFKNKESAVKYFEYIRNIHDGGEEGRYYGLFQKQAKMLGLNNGFIDLPSKDVQTVGNIIEYSENSYGKYDLSFKKGTGSTVSDCDGLEDIRNSLISKLSTEGSSEAKNLLDVLLNKDASKDYGWTCIPDKAYSATDPTTNFSLVGPLQDGVKNEDGKMIQYSSTKFSDRDYKLCIGNSVTLTPSSSYTYIVVSSGDVVINSGDFRGIIIAKGDVKLSENLSMECLGMLCRTKKIDSVVVESETDTAELTEFKALLDVVIYDENADGTVKKTEDGTCLEKTTTGNYKLRSIFGVADQTKMGGDPEENEYVAVNAGDWFMN